MGFLCYAIYMIQFLINNPYSRKIAYKIHAKDQIQLGNIFLMFDQLSIHFRFFFIIARQRANLLTRICNYFFPYSQTNEL